MVNDKTAGGSAQAEHDRRAARHAEHLRHRPRALDCGAASISRGSRLILVSTDSSPMRRKDTMSVAARPGETLGGIVERLAPAYEPIDRLRALLHGERLHFGECSGHRLDGEPCRAWAVRGSDRCRAHAAQR